MQTLFAPAVALMNRLRYRSKFLLLGTALTGVAAHEGLGLSTRVGGRNFGIWFS